MKKFITLLTLFSGLILVAQNQKAVGLVKGGTYIDLMQASIGQSVAIDLQAPVDSAVVAATDSLYLKYTHYDAGVNIGRRKILKKNNGNLVYKPTSEAIPLNTVWRFRTGEANDTIRIEPANNYKLTYEGQTTGNAVYITGKYNSGYLEKVAQDTLFFYSPDFVEYTVNPPLLYFLNNAATPLPNEENDLDGWSKDATNGTEQASFDLSLEATEVYDGATAIKATCSVDIVTTAAFLLELNNLVPGTTYQVSLWGRVSGNLQTNAFTRLKSTQGWLADDQGETFNLNTWENSILVGQATSSTAYISINSTTTWDAGEWIVVDNITVTPQ